MKLKLLSRQALNAQKLLKCKWLQTLYFWVTKSSSELFLIPLVYNFSTFLPLSPHFFLLCFRWLLISLKSFCFSFVVMRSIIRLWCESKYSCLFFLLLSLKPRLCFHFCSSSVFNCISSVNFIRIFNTDNTVNLIFKLGLFMWAVLGTDLCMIWILLIALALTHIGRQRKPAISLPWICYGITCCCRTTYKFAEERQIHSRQIRAAWSLGTS